jgi:transposase
MTSEEAIHQKYLNLYETFTERQKRLWAASEALNIGHGGVSLLQRITGLSRSTIHLGIKEIKKELSTKESSQSAPTKVRRTGGGRKRVEYNNSRLINELKQILEPATKGDPMRALLWTCKSTENIAKELKKKGYVISDRTVSRLLHDMGYSLQSNLKSIEGKQHPDRDSQFEYINAKIREFQCNGDPVVSVDTKKKELVGNFKNGGQEWHPQGQPLKVNVHDFESGKEQTKAIPYGIYDVTWNNAWVNVGIDHDTAEFAVESLRKWWTKMGILTYPEAKRLLITADGGGSNSSRGKLWKTELQKLSNELKMEITVCHLPPGTSKWNRIEHRLFCHITKNWRAEPLTSYEVIVNLISNTTTKQGLKVNSEIDTKLYEKGKQVSKTEIATMKIKFHEKNEKWNYTISPNHLQLVT